MVAATGRGACNQRSGCIARHTAYRAGEHGQAPVLLPHCAGVRRFKPFRCAQLQPAFARKIFGAGTDEHVVRCALHDAPGQRDGVAHMLHAGCGAHLQRGAVHYYRIHLHNPVCCKVGAAPGIEHRQVLQHLNGSFHCVDCAAAVLQDAPAGCSRQPAAVHMVGNLLVWNVASAAVHNDCAIIIRHCKILLDAFAGRLGATYNFP